MPRLSSNHVEADEDKNRTSYLDCSHTFREENPRCRHSEDRYEIVVKGSSRAADAADARIPEYVAYGYGKNRGERETQP